jgi:hypothetical protein
VEVRALSSEALQRGSTAEARARDAVMRSASHAQEIGNCVQNDRLRALFFSRPIVQRIMAEAKRYGGGGRSGGGGNGGGGSSMGGAR